MMFGATSSYVGPGFHVFGEQTVRLEYRVWFQGDLAAVETIAEICRCHEFQQEIGGKVK